MRARAQRPNVLTDRLRLPLPAPAARRNGKVLRLQHRRNGAHYCSDGGCELSVTLTPVIQSGYWRVRLTWPGHAARFFGRFNSEAEAEQWIAEHRWLTEQREPPNGDYPEGTDGC